MAGAIPLRPIHAFMMCIATILLQNFYSIPLVLACHIDVFLNLKFDLSQSTVCSEYLFASSTYRPLQPNARNVGTPQDVRCSLYVACFRCRSVRRRRRWVTDRSFHCSTAPWRQIRHTIQLVLPSSGGLVGIPSPPLAKTKTPILLWVWPWHGSARGPGEQTKRGLLKSNKSPPF